MAAARYDVFVDEREGQFAFFDDFGIDYESNEVLRDNTDGVWNGNLLEFKPNVTDPNRVLFQAVKYLSRMRVKGETIPANIMLVSLDSKRLYLYHSEDYRADIEQVYVGAASKNVGGFVAEDAVETIDYESQEGSFRVRQLLKENGAMAVNLDEDCIVGWAERYYRENPKATKGDFLGDGTGKINVRGEIRKPVHFKGLIRPYEKQTNERFKYLMDVLNDRLRRGDLGAFYTPTTYCKVAVGLVRKAIGRVPEGNDYVILDRCAGTGNLESELNEGELSHCILSTFEYYEYKVLVERLGDKVLTIIPPTEANVEYANGCVANADALSGEYIENPIIKRFLDDPKCTVILFENPPYRDQVADNKTKRGKKVADSFVFTQFKEELPNLPNANVSTAREIANQFIWSAWKYYLRQPTDSYILFSPIKYWKTLGLGEHEFLGGYLFNRDFFGKASASAISCILWGNTEQSVESLTLTMVAMEKHGEEADVLGEKTVHKAHKTFEPLFDRTTSENDVETPVYCEANGTEAHDRKCDGTSYTSPSDAPDAIIAYQRTYSFGVDPKHVALTRCTLYNIRGYYLRRNTYMKYLPLFAAKLYPEEEWYDRDVYFTTSDKGREYQTDARLIQAAFIYACLSPRNKCRSFTGSDGRFYRNELCFDAEAQASRDLKRMQLTEADRKLIAIWEKVLKEAKKTANYDKGLSYGVWQISQDLNTKHEVVEGHKTKLVPDYPELNGHLESLKANLKEYYKTQVLPKLFEHELLK